MAVQSVEVTQPQLEPPVTVKFMPEEPEERLVKDEGMLVSAMLVEVTAPQVAPVTGSIRVYLLWLKVVLVVAKDPAGWDAAI